MLRRRDGLTNQEERCGDEAKTDLMVYETEKNGHERETNECGREPVRLFANHEAIRGVSTNDGESSKGGNDGPEPRIANVGILARYVDVHTPETCAIP